MEAFAVPFVGSLSGQRLNAGVTAAGASLSDEGYWLASAEGGVFSFTTPFEGSAAKSPLNAPIVAMASIFH